MCSRYNCYVQKKQKGEDEMPFQAYYFLAIIAICAGIAVAMSISIKKHNVKMAAKKAKRPRRR
jgi:uncharacterized membrane protein